MDPLRELPYGPAARRTPHRRPDTCQHPTTLRALQKILLASTGASTHVHDDDVAWLEDGDQLLLDIGAKALAVDRSIEDARRCQPVVPQGTEECQRAPVTVRREGPQTPAFRSPAPDGCHVSLDPGLVDEDKASRIEMPLQGLPSLSSAGDIGAGLLKGEQRFF